MLIWYLQYKTVYTVNWILNKQSLQAVADKQKLDQRVLLATLIFNAGEILLKPLNMHLLLLPTKPDAI